MFSARRSVRLRAFVAGAIATTASAVLAVSMAPDAGAATNLIPVGQAAVTYGAMYPGAGPTVGFSSPAVGDVTGDGVPEVVVGGMDGCVRVFSLSGATVRGCLSVGAAAVQGSPVLADWDKNGVRDIIVASVGGGIFGWRGSGTPLFVFGTTGAVFSTPAVGDIDGDGWLDIAVGTWGQRITAYRHNGTMMFNRFVYDTIWSSPALADLDENGTLEVIVGGDMDIGNGANNLGPQFAPGGLVWVLKRDGSDLAGFPRHLSDQVIWSSPAVVDLNNDGHLDIVVGTGKNWAGKGAQLFALSRTGSNLPGWPVSMSYESMASPAIADVNNDGSLDVIQQSGDGTISYIRSNGSLIRRFCARSFFGCAPSSMDGSVSVGDVDGDGVQEVVSFVEAHLRVYSGATGNLEDEVNIPYTWAPGSTPTIARYNGDTYIVSTVAVDADRNGVRGAGDRQVTSIFRTGNGAGSLDWPMFRNNLRRTGTYDDEIAPSISGSFTAPNAGSTRLRVDWNALDGQSGVAGVDVEVAQDTLSFVRWVNGSGRGDAGEAVVGGRDLYALPGHDYSVRARARDRAGNTSAWKSLGTIAVPSDAVRAQPFRSAYAVSAFGTVSSVSSPPVKAGTAVGVGARGVAADPNGGGYTVDGFGGLHRFGGAPKLIPRTTWPGNDIVRGIALSPKGGGGLVLDGFGGVHPFGSARMPTSLPPYWPGWDIARGIVLTEDSRLAAPKGYVLDAFGGVHRFGGAPAVSTTAYWSGWAIARGIALDPAGAGGYVLDAFGGVHRFGGAPKVTPGAYWSGKDYARGIALIGGGAPGRGYVLDAKGQLHGFGSPPPVTRATAWSGSIARGLSIAP